ncbi:hypothetical protein KIH27_19245 [Mycobacterium sp. M1]|uniref:HTH tetR-type domain-containing protein n=2 Tax=Mycolicibacter acidiphilus TaxID=2835306 RepID=A0ABS5RN34_9MYCO|nr:hypothetical protein [Mycolicibacter acidiphilus]
MLIESGGLSVSMAHLNMEELIRIADVPRSSVYRAWGSREAFYVDLMERMVAPPPEGGYAEEVIRTARRVLDEHSARLDTPERRRAVLREMVRRTVTQSFHGAARSLAWRSFTALAVAVPTLDGDDRERILFALGRSHARIVERVSEIYSEALPMLGMRMRAGFDVKTLIATGSSAMDGLLRLGLIDPATVATEVVRPGVDGEPVVWELPAVAFLAVLEAMVEPDPEFPR